MTIKELIKDLKKENQSREIYIGNDTELNEIHPIFNIVEFEISENDTRLVIVPTDTNTLNIFNAPTT